MGQTARRWQSQDLNAGLFELQIAILAVSRRPGGPDRVWVGRDREGKASVLEEQHV